MLGEKVSWHWGFSAAGFGMVLGLIQYRMGVLALLLSPWVKRLTGGIR